MRATARAEAAAEDGFPADHYDCSLPIYTTDPYHRFYRTPAEDFYKKPVLCAAHVVGIADPLKYQKRLEIVQAVQRQQEDWSVRLKSDKPSYPEMYRKSYNSQELFNKELERQREEDQIRGTKVGDMDRATSGKGPSNEVGAPRGLKEKLIDQIRAIQADRRNAQATLAYERAKFHADCAARNIRTSEDAERAWIRIAVARAKVVRPEI